MPAPSPNRRLAVRSHATRIYAMIKIFYINEFLNNYIAWACSHMLRSGRLFWKHLSDTPHAARRLPAERYTPCSALFSHLGSVYEKTVCQRIHQLCLLCYDKLYGFWKNILYFDLRLGKVRKQNCLFWENRSTTNKVLW